MKTEIVMEDEHIIICRKPAGIATQTDKIGQQDVFSELKNDGRRPYIGMVHRLDQPVEGLLVFAKTKAAAANLSKQTANRKMVKKYYAVTPGENLPEAGALVDFLKKDNRTNRSVVAQEGETFAKKAELLYKVAARKAELALVEVELVTGRHHQIRVQMAHRDSPLLGDTKYGNERSAVLTEKYHVKNIALCAYRLEFDHPVTGQRMLYQIKPKESIFLQFEQFH